MVLIGLPCFSLRPRQPTVYLIQCHSDTGDPFVIICKIRVNWCGVGKRWVPSVPPARRRPLDTGYEVKVIANPTSNGASVLDQDAIVIRVVELIRTYIASGSSCPSLNAKLLETKPLWTTRRWNMSPRRSPENKIIDRIIAMEAMRISLPRPRIRFFFWSPFCKW